MTHEAAAPDKGFPVALVTGGGRGIGRATSLALAKAGFDLVVLDRLDDDASRACVEEIRSCGRQAHLLVGDIAKVEHHADLAEAIFSVFGTVDCLVNNAGVTADPRGIDLFDIPVESFDRVLDVNLRGTFFLTQQIAKRMAAASPSADHHRSIITITSAAVGRARIDSPEYAISKTALSLVAQCFALKLAEYGIATYEIRPGVIRTDLNRDLWDQLDTIAQSAGFPMPRAGLPTEVAQAVAALASGAMPYATGDRIYIDGGGHIPRSTIPPPARNETQPSHRKSAM
ncbi:MAG: 3-ketoacyl-ACP reductase [Chelatococcus sp.]|uniref:3-ketoacyl-ACP reductase n=1 Tax=Chelatococcus sp. TaxID=1953771 RepID=UPI0025BE5B79|nr:3-ketoacyl-ACP reductase [Chelatococcus sp.]MBX3538387.1 3-ketoacyl-ACP reductase [Chelatococcus sp.]